MPVGYDDGSQDENQFDAQIKEIFGPNIAGNNLIENLKARSEQYNKYIDKGVMPKGYYNDQPDPDGAPTTQTEYNKLKQHEGEMQQELRRRPGSTGNILGDLYGNAPFKTLPKDINAISPDIGGTDTTAKPIPSSPPRIEKDQKLGINSYLSSAPKPQIDATHNINGTASQQVDPSGFPTNTTYIHKDAPRNEQFEDILAKMHEHPETLMMHHMTQMGMPADEAYKWAHEAVTHAETGLTSFLGIKDKYDQHWRDVGTLAKEQPTDAYDAHIAHHDLKEFKTKLPQDVGDMIESFKTINDPKAPIGQRMMNAVFFALPATREEAVMKEVAEMMKDAGHNIGEIANVTGWAWSPTLKKFLGFLHGADKMEINADEMHGKYGRAGPFPLKEVVGNWPELFNRFPWLADYKIKLQKNLEPNGGSINTLGKVIKLFSLSQENIKQAIAHEVNHAVAERHGLPEGSSPEIERRKNPFGSNWENMKNYGMDQGEILSEVAEQEVQWPTKDMGELAYRLQGTFDEAEPRAERLANEMYPKSRPTLPTWTSEGDKAAIPKSLQGPVDNASYWHQRMRTLEELVTSHERDPWMNEKDYNRLSKDLMEARKRVRNMTRDHPGSVP